MAGSDNIWAQVGRYGALAFVLPVSVGVGWVIGALLDKLFHTHFLYVVFLLLGVAAGLIDVYRTLQADSRRDGS
ncbi:MAG TPA: AtpZ/AtpI family protein [Bryobacteraceae bacterium]|nr:AtpZ/AtpI family protein [Bryobacteraceae bacterium]